MKNSYFSHFFLLLAITLFSFSSFAQDGSDKEKEKAAAIKQMIEEKTYTFNAEFLSPMKGGRRYLDPGYTLKVRPDTVISDLPYFGRAYSAEYGASDGGLKATSTNFEYTMKERKKGGWDITIKTKDQKDQLQMMLTVFDNGTASLNVNSTNRQPISYDGYIEVKKPASK
jgi:hypothetical protein